MLFRFWKLICMLAWKILKPCTGLMLKVFNFIFALHEWGRAGGATKSVCSVRNHAYEVVSAKCVEESRKGLMKHP